MHNVAAIKLHIHIEILMMKSIIDGMMLRMILLV
jgi:hypothetical protein